MDALQGEVHDRLHEQQRRSAVQSIGSAMAFEASVGTAHPPSYDIADQVVFLMSISHRDFAPRCSDGVGAIRLYGAFETVEDAQAHCAHVVAEDPGVSMMCVPAREWSVVTSSPERFGDAALTERLRLETLSRLSTSAEEEAEHFRQRVARPCSDDAAVDVAAAPSSECAAPPEPASRKFCKNRLSQLSLVAGQDVAVISSVMCPDSQEFIVRPYACFGTDAEADAWIRNVASHRITDVDMDVVKLGAWIRPGTMTGSKVPREEYRNPELNAIMKNRAQESARVEQVRENFPVNVIDV